MALRSLTQQPFRAEKRLFLFLGFLSIPGVLYASLCSYLRDQAVLAGSEGLMLFSIYSCTFLYLYARIRLRKYKATKFFLRYRLTMLYVREAWNLRRIALTGLTALTRFSIFLSELTRWARPNRQHTILPADSTRASKNSSYYKNLLKRYE